MKFKFGHNFGMLSYLTKKIRAFLFSCFRDYIKTNLDQKSSYLWNLNLSSGWKFMPS